MSSYCSESLICDQCAKSLMRIAIDSAELTPTYYFTKWMSDFNSPTALSRSPPNNRPPGRAFRGFAVWAPNASLIASAVASAASSEIRPCRAAHGLI